jgi:hypothetical protein
MDEKWDKIVTITFWMNLIMPFSILLPYEWLNAFLYLDPFHATPGKSTIDWAVATFAFMGLLLALFVPKVSEFDRQLTKEMDVTDPEIKPSTWRCVLFRLYQKEPYSRKWVFDFFLSSQHYFIILCVLGGVFIFCPILRGVLILGTLIYSYYILISMESLSNIEQYETLFLKNIKDPEVFALLKKYVEKVYSTEGHPRQEIFYRLFTEKHDKGVEYHTLLNLIHQKLIYNKCPISSSLTNRMVWRNIPSDCLLVDNAFSRSELRKYVERFQEVLEIIEHNPVGVHWTQEKLLSRAYCGECILNSQDLKDASILYGFSDSSDTDSNRLNELIRQDFLNIFPCKERRWVSETNDVSQKPEFCFINDDHCMFRTHLIKMDYLNAYLRFLRYTQNKEALKSFAENFATEYKNGYRSRDVTWVTSIDYEELFCLVCITLGSYYRTRDSDSFLQKKATDIHYKYDGATLIILGIVHACQEMELESWLKEGHLLHYCLKNIPALKELLIVSPKIGTYFESEIKKTVDLPFIQDAFSLNDEDITSLLEKWKAFHTKLKSLYEEEGWSHA